jgi:hypothetical protein
LQPYNDLITLSLDTRTTIKSNAAITFRGNVDYDEQRTASSFNVGFPTIISSFWNINPKLFYSELNPLREESFAYWQTRGYSFGQELGIPTGDVSYFQNTILGVALGNQFSIAKNWAVSIQPKYIRHRTLNVPWQLVIENEFLDTRPGEFTNTEENGSRLSLLAEIKHQVGQLLHQKMTVHFQHTLEGTDRYKEYFKQIPETKIDYQLTISPVSDLGISLQATYRASTEWIEYEALDGVEYKIISGVPIRPFSGTFNTQTPSFINLKLGVQKWLWEKRLNTKKCERIPLVQSCLQNSMLRWGYNFNSLVVKFPDPLGRKKLLKEGMQKFSGIPSGLSRAFGEGRRTAYVAKRGLPKF